MLTFKLTRAFNTCSIYSHICTHSSCSAVWDCGLIIPFLFLKRWRPVCYWVTSMLLLKLMHTMEQLCVIFNKKAPLHLTVTNCISHESSMSQQSGDMFYFHFRLRDNLWEQNDCHSIGAFCRAIAGMMSQIRLLWLISMRGWLHRLMAWQRLEGWMKKVRTSFKIILFWK